MAVQWPRRAHELPLDLLNHRPSRGDAVSAGERANAMSNDSLVTAERQTGPEIVTKRIGSGSPIAGAPVQSDRCSLCYLRSSLIRSVLIAKAASAPSAAATITHCTARDASPATNSPGRCVVSYLPVAIGSLVVDFAAETDRQLRLLELAGGEEQRAPWQRVAVFEDHALEHPVGALESRDPVLPNVDAVALQTRESLRIDLGRPVGAQHEVARSMPSVRGTARVRGCRGRKSQSAGPALPSRRSTGQWNTLRPYSSLNPFISGTLSTTPVAISSLREKTTRASSSIDSEAAAGDAFGRRCTCRDHLDGVVFRQLTAAHLEEFARRRAVAGQVAVQRVRRGVARFTGIADQHGSAAPSEDERRRSTRRARRPR